MLTEQEIKQLAFTGKLIEALRPLANFLPEFREGDETALIFDKKLNIITIRDCRKAKELIEEWERNY